MPKNILLTKVLSILIGVSMMLSTPLCATNAAAASRPHLNKTTLKLFKGRTYKLVLKNAKASKVTWKSKSPKIAKVNKKGVVKGLKIGKTKVIAKYRNKKYTCAVIVKRYITGGEVGPIDPAPNNDDYTTNQTRAYNISFIKRFLLADAKDRMCSPLSLEFAVGACSLAADSAYQTTIATTLGYQSADEMFAHHKELLSKMQAGNDETKVSISNSFWLDERVVTNDKYAAFKDTLNNFYQAKITENLKLYTDETRQLVNKWANDATNGLIPEFRKANYDFDDQLVNINALYFKSVWGNKFYLEKNRDFHGANGVIKRNYFSDAGHYSYAKMGNIESIRLPYKNNYWMTLYKTVDNSDLTTALNNLSEKELQALFNMKYETYLVTFRVPTFETESDISIESGTLESMGFPKNYIAVNVDDDTKEIRAHQVTKIKCDENGTEAAAVTEVISKTTSTADPNQKKANFFADYGFMYTISYSPVADKTVIAPANTSAAPTTAVNTPSGSASAASPNAASAIQDISSASVANAPEILFAGKVVE